MLIHAVIYAVYKFGYIRFTKGKKAVLLYILYSGIVIAINIGFIWWAVQPVLNGTMTQVRHGILENGKVTLMCISKEVKVDFLG